MQSLDAVTDSGHDDDDGDDDSDASLLLSDAELAGWRHRFEEPDAAELAGSAIPEPPASYASWWDWAAERWPTLPDLGIRTT